MGDAGSITFDAHQFSLVNAAIIEVGAAESRRCKCDFLRGIPRSLRSGSRRIEIDRWHRRGHDEAHHFFSLEGKYDSSFLGHERDSLRRERKGRAAVAEPEQLIITCC